MKQEAAEGFSSEKNGHQLFKKVDTSVAGAPGSPELGKKAQMTRIP
jgi:hypothetical protein